MMTIDEVLENIGQTKGVHGGNAFMLTASGNAVDLVDPQPEQITLEDICHHLGRLSRFTGAINRDHYSVAQHLLLSAAIAHQALLSEAAVQYRSVEYFDQMLAVALHDAEEYAFNDLSSPVKATIAPSKYKTRAVHLRNVIYTKFGVDLAYENDCVKHADLNALVTERYILLPASHHWPRVRADQLFTRSLPAMGPQEATARLYSLITDLLEARDLAVEIIAHAESVRSATA